MIVKILIYLIANKIKIKLIITNLMYICRITLLEKGIITFDYNRNYKININLKVVLPSHPYHIVDQSP